MLKRYFPIAEWLPSYDRHTLSQDLFAAVIVTLMVIPQALAYALLAGLPAVTGLYASMLPLVAYTIFGTSRTLAVGPMAIVALMTAAALSGIVATGTVAYSEAAATLAFLSGVMLMLMGIFRLGFFANFLSHPVVSGLLSASGVLIATSQLGNLLGITMSGFTLIEQLTGLVAHWEDFNVLTALIGLGSLAFLMVMRRASPTLRRLGMTATLSGFITKAGPIIAVMISTLLVWAFNLEAHGVAVVGDIPRHLPPLALPSLDPTLISTLLMPAFLISLVGFIESVSLAQMLAAKRRQRISPDQELFALGGSNIAAAVSSSMPVTGSLSRTVINFDAGARTPAAGSFAALGVALVTLYLTPLIHFLPIATLAASIIVSTFTLLDAHGLKRTWHYSKRDFAAMLATIVLTFVSGVEVGVMVGVGLSLALFLYTTSRPHSALVGRVPGTEHFRNVERYTTENDPRVALLRVDESLYFANARYLEDTVYAMVAERPALKHVVLISSAVNLIDASALESLEAINSRLDDSQVKLHLAEVKGPVMDKLKHSDFLDHLTGDVFLSTYHAWEALRDEDTVVTPLDSDTRQD
ncbi:sulfate permease [Chromohalobacter canadensis]|uniref:SulP family inorganic anion transporter n=1 Tax=Chromohalobacter canadensis TaxID=141389 RepID=UPI0021C1EC01|nr:sulfate permease [Chromohalobacter canadensis]MCT8469821.1 sulfate permease [Chromohalobacter canadensis]MCT8472345.1 sulfate permease [Chromohalobacter canadensis]MCT8499543.1 sulfate permease [Chromohalobacter canadensis]